MGLAAFLVFCLWVITPAALAESQAATGLPPLVEIGFSPWASSAIKAAYESHMLPSGSDLGTDFTRPITRQQFVHLMLELIVKQKDTTFLDLATEYKLVSPPQSPAPANSTKDAEIPEFISPFSDTNSIYAALASAMDIARGSEGLFRPSDYISRCEAAAFLYRSMAALGQTSVNITPLAYADIYDLPRWAVEPVKFCSGRASADGTPLMLGSGGYFTPLGSYTIEQAIISLQRFESSLGTTALASDWQDAPGYDSVEIALSFGGDCTFGSGIGFAYHGSFEEMYAQVDPSYFFSGIEEFFSDDLTMVNFEGILTSASVPANKTFVFKGKPEYAKALKAGSIDVVTVANNHSMDYLKRGYEDSIANLSPYVAVSGYEMQPIIEVKGVKVGFASNMAWSFDKSQKSFVESSIAKLRERGADIVVFNYHWGIERSYKSSAYQQSLARYCIDSGADLVIGHHPHVIQETESYKGKQIAYSLGNLVFGGNQNPRDKNCLIFRQSFSMDLDSRIVSDAGHMAIPYKISSMDYRNDYHPTKG